jgi:hypothetical protein
LICLHVSRTDGFAGCPNPPQPAVSLLAPERAIALIANNKKDNGFLNIFVPNGRA